MTIKIWKTEKDWEEGISESKKIPSEDFRKKQILEEGLNRKIQSKEIFKFEIFEEKLKKIIL